MLNLWGKTCWNLGGCRQKEEECRGAALGDTRVVMADQRKFQRENLTELALCYFWKGEGVRSLKEKAKMLKAVFSSKYMSALCFLSSKCPWWKHTFAIIICRFISVSLPVKGRSLLFVNLLCPQFLAQHLAIWIHLNQTGFMFLFIPLLLFLSLFCLSVYFTPSLLHSFLFLHQLLRLLRARCIYGCVGSDSWLWLCTRPCRTCVYLFQPSLLPRLLCIFVFFGVYAEVFRCSSYLETLTHSLIW